MKTKQSIGFPIKDKFKLHKKTGNPLQTRAWQERYSSALNLYACMHSSRQTALMLTSRRLMASSEAPVSQQVSTSPLPFILTMPRSSISYPPILSKAWRHWGEMWILSGKPLDSMREAVFTVSPNRQYLGIVRPTTPATTGPVQQQC